MKPYICALCVLGFHFPYVVVGIGRIGGPQQNNSQITVSANEVVLDIVVRDKKGRPVKDLTAKDFEVMEDGVKQEITSFRLVIKEPPEAASLAVANTRSSVSPGTAPAPSKDSLEKSSFVALAFDRLSPNARSLAQKAALSYLTEDIDTSELIGVFSIDLSLNTIQQYTNNTALLRQAVDRATSASPAAFASSAPQGRDLAEKQDQLVTQSTAAEGVAAGAGRANGPGAGGSIGAANAEEQLNAMNIRMLETFETLERDQQGYATTDGLLAIINSLASLQGRKSVIFFSEGMALPPAVQAHFRSVINAANRSGVSVYTVDAAGLRVESATAESAKEINSLAARRSAQAATGRDDNSGPMTRQLERNEDLLRLNPHSGLADLADETGGFLVAETNDLGAGLHRVDEDMRMHYVLTYAPRDQSYDGRFRQISVKVGRPSLEVQTRKGYFAVPPLGPFPVLDYEAPAVAKVMSPGFSSALPVRVTGLSFPEWNKPGLAPVVIEAPMGDFTYTPDDKKQSLGTDFSIVVLIRDQRSHGIVGKMSQRYRMSVPPAKLEDSRKGSVLFYREAQLPPGHYEVEAIAFDAASRKAGVRMSNLTVPDVAGAKMRSSDLVIIKRAEKLSAEDQKESNPFHFGDMLVYPNLGEPFQKSTGKQIPFFLTVYLPKGAADTPKLSLEILQSNQSIARLAASLPAPDASGRIQYLSALPLDKFPPGNYELKATIEESGQTLTRTSSFTVQP